MLTGSPWATTMANTTQFLELHISSNGINYYIDYNDMKVFNELRQSSVSQVVPVNQWSINGDNTLLISVNFKTEIQDEVLKIANEASLVVTLVVREKREGQEIHYAISEFNLKPSAESSELIASSSSGVSALDSNNKFQKSENGNVITSEWTSHAQGKWIDFNQNIHIDINLPKWSFLSADDLGNANDMTDDEFFGLADSLYLEYQNIWNLMKVKDKEALLKLMGVRASEYDAAFHLESGNKINEMERSLTSAFEHEDLSLSSLIGNEETRFRIEGNGRVASLKDDLTGEPIIYYSHKRGSFTRFYDFYFMKKDGKWIVIR